MWDQRRRRSPTAGAARHGRPRLVVGTRLGIGVRSVVGLLTVLLCVAFPQKSPAQEVTAGEELVWEQVLPPLSIRDLYFDEGDTLWTIGRSESGDLNGVLKRPPGGEWIELATFPPEHASNATYILKTRAGTIITSQAGATYRSTDGGLTFGDEVVGRGGPLLEVRDGPHAGLLVASGGDNNNIDVMTSSDDGVTWSGVGLDDPFGRAESFVSISDGSNAGRLVAACQNGLAYSDDGGQTWALSNLWEPFLYYAFDVERMPAGSKVPGRLFAGVEDGGASSSVYRSDDDGATWEFVRDFGNQIGYTTVRWVGGGTLYAVVEQGKVWRSDDAGATWYLVSDLDTAVGVDIAVDDVVVGLEGRLWVVVNTPGSTFEGKGIYRTVAPVPVATEGGPDGPTSAEALTLGAPYPNPSAGGVTVPLALARTAAVRVTVIDMLGREVAVLHDGSLAAGRHPFTLDGSDLLAGLYVVRVVGEGLEVTQRVTILR